MMEETHRLSSKKPYFIRALYEWCEDNALTPQMVVSCDETVQVPPHHIRDGEITFNISRRATSNLNLGNHYITFQARFGGGVWDISIPVCRVSMIFCRETGDGIPFDIEEAFAPSLSVVQEMQGRAYEKNDVGDAIHSSGDKLDDKSPLSIDPTTTSRRPTLIRVK